MVHETLLVAAELAQEGTGLPLVSIIMPQLGESIAEATVINLLVKEGDRVEADQDVIEVETNKATMNVTAPGAGRVEKILVKLNESYPVGAVLGRLEVTEAEAERLGLDESREPEPLSANGNGNQKSAVQTRVEPTVRGLPVPALAQGTPYMCPPLHA